VVVSRELSSEVINRWPDAEVMATSNGAK
jgi:hypothetical protein